MANSFHDSTSRRKLTPLSFSFLRDDDDDDDDDKGDDDKDDDKYDDDRENDILKKYLLRHSYILHCKHLYSILLRVL